jgi:hypothetical protein
LATGGGATHPPYGSIEKDPETFIERDYLPQDMVLLQARTMKEAEIAQLFDHIGHRQELYGAEKAFRFKSFKHKAKGILPARYPNAVDDGDESDAGNVDKETNPASKRDPSTPKTSGRKAVQGNNWWPPTKISKPMPESKNKTVNRNMTPALYIPRANVHHAAVREGRDWPQMRDVRPKMNNWWPPTKISKPMPESKNKTVNRNMTPALYIPRANVHHAAVREGRDWPQMRDVRPKMNNRWPPTKISKPMPESKNKAVNRNMTPALYIPSANVLTFCRRRSQVLSE